MTEAAADQSPIRVFISYARRDADHAHAAMNLWTFLRNSGIDARIDLPEEVHRHNWAVWIEEQILSADFVIVVASPAYREHAERGATDGVGRGVSFEATLLRELIYRDPTHWLRRILPVVLPGQDDTGIPEFLSPASASVYRVAEFTTSGAETLLRTLLSRNKYPAPPIAARTPDLPAIDTGRILGLDKQLSVILLGASPFDIALGRLRGDQEFLAIGRTARTGSLRVAARELATANDIGTILLDKPDILHICGHYSPADNALILDHPTDTGRSISLDALAARMALGREYGMPTLRAIVFSVGDGADFAENFLDVADSVISWKEAITPECTRSFCALFYSHLAREPQRSLPGAVRLAARDISQSAACSRFADRLVLFSR